MRISQLKMSVLRRGPNLILLLLMAVPLAAVAQQVAEKDSDKDGIPDEWELKYGCDPNDPADAALDYDLDGFSNLEEYRSGTNPGNDIVGHKALGKMQPLGEWTPDKLMEELDRSSPIPWGRFFVLYDYYDACASKTNKVASERALLRAYTEGMQTLAEMGQPPRGFLASIRYLGKKTDHRLDLSSLLASTNSLVQQTALASLRDHEVTEADIQNVMKHFDKLQPQPKIYAISVLAEEMSPGVQSFLEKVEDSSITNLVRGVLLDWEDRAKKEERSGGRRRPRD